MENEAYPPLTTGEASARFQGTDLPTRFRYKSGISKRQPLRCERVNEATFKITAGEFTNVPSSHGQWGGYRTSKAAAWLIKIGPDAWLARCGNRVSGPSSFSEAKAKSLAMAKGMDGDYFLQNPVAHLNGLQARLCDGGGGTGNA